MRSATLGALAHARAGSQVPAVDLLVRTSGERRLSNFLLWQAAGARLAFLDVRRRTALVRASTARPRSRTDADATGIRRASVRARMQVLWPALSAWSFFAVLIQFQLSQPAVASAAWRDRECVRSSGCCS